MVELAAATPSATCRQSLGSKYNLSPLFPLRDSRDNLHIWRKIVAETGGLKTVTGDSYLHDYYQASYLVILAEQAPLFIDRHGVAGWDLLFSMLPTWRANLLELPGVVASILEGSS